MRLRGEGGGEGGGSLVEECEEFVHAYGGHEGEVRHGARGGGGGGLGRLS